MSVYACKKCGSSASTLARCPGCGTILGSLDRRGLSPGATRRFVPVVLAVIALSLSVPAAIQAAQSYNTRIAREQLESERLMRVERAKQQEEEHRALIKRADSILKAIPRWQIEKLSSDELNADIALVGQRSDPVASRWIKTGNTELKRRSAKKKRSHPAG